MGRFSTVCLLLLSACGDDLVRDDFEPAPADVVVPSDVAAAVPRYVPTVCGTQTWTTNFAANIAMDISVTMTASGAAVLATPSEGGPLTGFLIDSRIETADISKLDINGQFSSATASYPGNRLASMAVADSTIVVHLLEDDMTNPQYVTKMKGRFLSEPTFLDTPLDRVVPTAGDDGLWLHRFQDDLFAPIDSWQVIPTDAPATAMAATQMGVATMMAMSTQDDCYMTQIGKFGFPGLTTRVGRTCDSPRFAVNGNQAIMVHDSAEGVRLMNIVTTMFGGDARVLSPGTFAPRAVFDGSRYWVSYLDEQGDLVVGYLDRQYQPVAMSLAGLRPEPQAYELVVLDGSPYIFALTAEGYTATRMCLDKL